MLKLNSQNLEATMENIQITVINVTALILGLLFTIASFLKVIAYNPFTLLTIAYALFIAIAVIGKARNYCKKRYFTKVREFFYAMRYKEWRRDFFKANKGAFFDPEIKEVQDGLNIIKSTMILTMLAFGIVLYNIPELGFVIFTIAFTYGTYDVVRRLAVIFA